MNDTSEIKISEQERRPAAAISGLRLRPATPTDEDILMSVFASTRSAELEALSGNPAMLEMFLKMQYQAQSQNYRGLYPKAENKIVLLDEKPIGRLLVDRAGQDFLLIDIALLPEHRNSGIGQTLLEGLLHEAKTCAKAVKLHVVRSSSAVRFYERLGFTPIGGDDVYIEMSWTSSQPNP